MRAKRLMIPLLLATALTAAGCGGGSNEPPEVAWGTKYADQLKTRIDGKAEAGDCEGLQREAGIAEGNDEYLTELTGEGSDDLQAYISYQQQEAGCTE